MKVIVLFTENIIEIAIPSSCLNYPTW